MATLPNQQREVNSFVTGIITEATPLNFPEGASFSEVNFDIRRDGSRQRRQGIDYENNAVLTNVGPKLAIQGESISSYRWDNAGRDFNNSYLVVQVGNTLYFFDNQTSSPSRNLTASVMISYEHSSESGNRKFRYATLNGNLIVSNLSPTSSIPTVFLVITEADGAFSVNEGTIVIRDTFGVDDELYNTEHPTTLTDKHYYNLLNQGWPADRIQEYNTDQGEYPNNTQIWHAGKYTDLNTGQEEFSPSNLNSFDFGSRLAPKGRAVINAFFRGEYRFESHIVASDGEIDSDSSFFVPYYGYNEANDNYIPGLKYFVPTDTKRISDLPNDRDDSPSVKSVASFAGRLWFAGISRESVTEASDVTPDYSSFIFFSQTIRNPQDYGACYSENDPTSEEFNDILDTDGGFVNILEANNIQLIKPLDNFLVVFAENGVWSITGGELGFNATSYRVKKISDVGLFAPDSVVAIEEGLLFWANSGIYIVTTGQGGFNLSVQSLTQNTIQSLYDDITSVPKSNAVGFYDQVARKVRWVYKAPNGGIVPDFTAEFDRELVFDKVLGAFYENHIDYVAGTSPFICGIVGSSAFSIRQRETFVIDSSGTNIVTTSNDEEVVIQESVRDNSVGTTKYPTLVPSGDDYFLTFSEYIDPTFKDWKTFDGVGVDAEARLVTGYSVQGDTQRAKGLKYLTTHFRRTETGFVDDGNGNLSPENPSSCLVRVRWDFANNIDSNKYSRQFEAYRLNRFYIPEDANDPFDYGKSVITTKNKIRGYGTAMQIEFVSSPEKDLQLLGWGLSITGVPNV